jgi:hypothetical protein
MLVAARLVASPAPRDEWRRLLAEDPDALAFHDPRWTDAIVDAGGGEDASRLCDVGGRSVVVPLIRRRLGPVELLASLPFGWGFGGAVPGRALDGEAGPALLAALGRRAGIQLTVRPNPLVADAWSAAAGPSVRRVARRAHILDLAGGFEAVWSRRFQGPVRTAVRKAERSGVEVEVDRTGALVREFYELYERSILRWSASGPLPPASARRRAAAREPLRKYQAAARDLGDAFEVWVARVSGRPAAAIVVLAAAGAASYWRGAMDEALAGPVRANQLLHRLAIEAACNRGARAYHMGETGTSATLADFKERLGAVPITYSEVRIERVPLTEARQLGERAAAASLGLARRVRSLDVGRRVGHD